MRLAREFGTIRELYPPGINDLTDLPYTIFEAIRTALGFLTFDELPEEERPPKRIWLDGERLREWFDEVKRKRKAEAEGKSVEDPVENEYAKRLRSGR